MVVAKYMAARLLGTFAGMTAALSGVMFAVQWMRMGRAVTARDVDLLLLSLVPVSSFVIPMALLFSVLLVLERLSLESEIVAMRASGVRGPKLFAPVVALALACAVVHLAVTTTLGPLAAGKIRDRLVESAPRKILAFFEEREFSDRFKNVVMYVEAVNQRKRQIKGIFLETSSPAQVVVSAEKGTVDVDGTQVTLRLFKGSIFTQTDRADRYLTFGEYSFMLDADVVSLMRIKSYETATQGEFRRLISENPTPKRIREYHARYAFPVLNLLLAAIGIAFGVQNPRSPRYTGFLVGMATVMGYYLVNVMGARLTNAHAISPVWGAWLPDAAFTAFLVATASARMSLRAAKRRRALPRAR